MNFGGMAGSRSILGTSGVRVDTDGVRGYGQFCPIARGSEVVAERWTPIILRNVLLGCRTFNEIAAGAPGLSRALLTRRLRELARAGVIEIRPKPAGRGSLYEPTPQGRELWDVLRALGSWAERWMEVTPEHAEPDVVLWSWCESFLRRDLLPDRRVVVRFEFTVRTGRRVTTWLLIDRGEAEICSFDPGFGDDLVVVVVDPLAFARWHLGLDDWASALRSGSIRVEGPRQLRRQLPTWNAGPEIHIRLRAEHGRAPGSTPLPPPGTMPRPHPVGAATGRKATAPLGPNFAGEVIDPTDPGYDDARAVWNGAIDRHPRWIVRCSTPADVVAALRFGRQRDVAITVRGGGHGVAGTSVCDDGLVIDLGPIKRIAIDPTGRRVTVGAGVRWGELDAATQAFGLATTGGTMSRTGVSGLTLGGGIGWLMRRHGLTVDNLLSAEMVTADGTTLTASDDEEPELFWGIRGGGPGLGVVTALTYQLHPVGPDVVAGLVLWRLEDGPDVLRAYRDFIASAPPDVATAVALRRAPPAPFLPVELHRRPVCAIVLAAFGAHDRGEQLLAPMRSFGRPLLDLINVRPYTDLQSMFDNANPDGWHYYWKSAGLHHLDDGTIDTLVDHAHDARSPWSYSVLFHLGGAVAAVDPEATAYSRRDVAHQLNVNAVWQRHEPFAATEPAWARNLVAALSPRHAGVYLNFLDRDDQHRVGEAFTPTAYARLTQLQQQLDPDNLLTARAPTLNAPASSQQR